MVSAYVMPIEYKGIKIKLYEINKTDALEQIKAMIDKAPQEQLKNLGYVKYFEGDRNDACMLYHPYQGISIFGKRCINNLNFRHELVHKVQLEKGDTLYNLIFHKGIFCDELNKTIGKDNWQYRSYCVKR